MRRLASTLTMISYLVLIPIVLLLVYRAGGSLMALIGDGALVAIIVTVAAGLAAGHFLGGPDPTHRTALAVAAATRHPGVAGLIVHQHFEDPRVMLAVLLFLLTSLLVSAVYQAGNSRQPDDAGRGRPPLS